jgi:hypothetical protein
MSEFTFYLFVLCLISAIMGAYLGEQKQATTAGLLFGFFLGPLGVITAGFLDRRPFCAECGGRLNATKERWFPKCQHCGAAQSRKATEPTWDEHLDEAGQRLKEAVAGGAGTPT